MSTDIPDLIAGALGVSRGTAYDMMREALDKEDIYRLAAESIKEGLRLDDWDKIGCVNHDCDKCKAQQEPLGYIAIMALNDLQASIYRDVAVYGEDLEDTVAIYTTPQAQPAREPLTDEQERKAFELYWRNKHNSTLYCESEYRGWKARAAHGINTKGNT